jgi:hypothetical protein
MSRRDTVLLAVVVLVAAVLIAAYLAWERPRSHGAQAAIAVGVLTDAFREKASDNPLGPVDTSAPLIVSLFLDTDATQGVQATPEIRRSWEAFRVAHHLLTLRSQGATEVPVARVPGSDAALASLPGLSKYVSNREGVPTFAETTETVSYLVEAGTAAAEKAHEELVAQYGPTGLDITAIEYPNTGKRP